MINHHARNTLESFGSWAARGSDQDDRSDDHYDYGILITRYNICADETQPCDLLGEFNFLEERNSPLIFGQFSLKNP